MQQRNLIRGSYFAMNHTPRLSPDGDFKPFSVADLKANAAETARYLKLIANERRLLILCALAVHGESTVNALSEEIGLGQSAMSQHLARLRADRLVDFRKDGQMAYYRIADRRVEALLGCLKDIFC